MCVRIPKSQSRPRARLSPGSVSRGTSKEQRKVGDDDAAIWFWREVDAGWGIGEGGSDAGILPLEGRWW